MAFPSRDGVQCVLRCKRDVDSFPTARGLSAGISVPLDDAVFYTTLRRGFDVQLLHKPQYSEAVNMWPHPEHGHIVFPMTLLQATHLEQRFPEFSTEGSGVCGQWRLERKDMHLSLTLVRVLPLPEFWTLVREPGVNPEWLEPCFAAYRHISLEALARMPVEEEDAE